MVRLNLYEGSVRTPGWLRRYWYTRNIRFHQRNLNIVITHDLTTSTSSNNSQLFWYILPNFQPQVGAMVILNNWNPILSLWFKDQVPLWRTKSIFVKVQSINHLLINTNQTVPRSHVLVVKTRRRVDRSVIMRGEWGYVRLVLVCYLLIDSQHYHYLLQTIKDYPRHDSHIESI